MIFSKTDESMNKSESIVNIAIAMKNFQNEVEQPAKSADNPYFKSKYVPLPAVMASIKKSAAKHGLSYTQAPVSNEKGVGVQTMIMHESGEFIEFPVFYLPLDKQTPQAGGSAITYAKRYSLSAAFGIDSEFDDDGNEASKPAPVPAQKEDMTPEIFEATKQSMIAAQTNKALRSPKATFDAAMAKMNITEEQQTELKKLIK